ncbi:hypothetical protein [Rufibacter quisquiliarum]|uniref:Uncharacterized protein n=1 Tax=Rufibacter quisquiliarum TaxID=1549639 RepID=A0A839GTZ2_9BACT|nr:hypothetical protein [Rufibacter quisquiliarum]MBA9078337.1 hypothetical protein [Rufibacter quisquiliarum]
MYQFQLSNAHLGTRILVNDPVGWDSLKTELVRDATYKGISITASSDLEFVKDGRNYLLAAEQNEGIEANVACTLKEYNPNTFGYEEKLTGRIGFDKFKDDGIRVSADITQDTTAQLLLNQDDVEVNLLSDRAINGNPLPSSVNYLQEVELHSKVILQKYRGRSKGQANASYPTFVTEGWARSPYILFGFNEVELNELNLTNTMSGFLTYDGPVEIPEVYKSDAMGRFDISLNIDATITIGLVDGDFDKATIWYYFRVNNGPEQQFAYFSTSTAGGTLKERLTGVFSASLNLNKGDKVYVYGRVLVEDVSGSYRLNYVIQMADASFLYIDFQGSTSPTPCKGMLVHEAFSRVCESLLGRSPAFYSEFFGRTDSQAIAYAQDGKGSLLFYTGGFQISNFPLQYESGTGGVSARPLTANFKDLFEGLDALYCLGCGIEKINGVEMVRVEPLSYFFRKEVVAELGEVTKLTRSVAMEYHYSAAEFGFQKWKTGQENSLDEFNAKQTSLTPLTQTKNKYSKLSKLIGGGFLIEEARRKQYEPEEDQQSDSADDDSKFIVCLLRDNDNVFVTERNQVIELGNVYSPETVYNARLSPKRRLTETDHGRVLKGALLKQMQKQVAFSPKSEGNFRAGTKYPGEAEFLYEDSSIAVADLPEAMWVPEYFEFEAPLSEGQVSAIMSNPYGMVGFVNTLKPGSPKGYGFILSMEQEKDTSLAKFKLLGAYGE